jgi:hypothetical protein
MRALLARIGAGNLISLLTALLIGVGGVWVLGIFTELEEGFTIGPVALWLIEHRSWMPLLPAFAVVVIVVDIAVGRPSWLRRGLVALLLAAPMIWVALGIILAVAGIYGSALNELAH